MRARVIRPRSALALCLGALLLAGCRDAPGSFVAVDRPPATGDSARLTFSAGDDRSPAWGRADTLYYAAAGFDPYPLWPGMAFKMALEDGRALPVFPSLVGGPLPRRLATPAPAPAEDLVVYVSLTRLADSVVCHGGTVLDPGDPRPVHRPRAPALYLARLNVRAPGATRSEDDDPHLDLRFASVEPAPEVEFPGVPENALRYVTRVHPFQQLYLTGGELAFRPSWSPDGRSIVFGDGLRLLRWRIGETPIPIPGTEGLIGAAWGPREDLVAATRPVVVDSTLVRYIMYSEGVAICAELRVNYQLGQSRIVLLGSDGSTRDLGQGGEVAWAPDGAALYARRADGIWRVPVDGGAATRVPGTDGGGEPAVSRDGRYLAFSRRNAVGNHDLYVVRIAP